MVPRPRLHQSDRILDAVESLAVESGPAAVTIRAVSAAVGVSNGALYHTFTSRSGLLGQAWLRAARRFLAAQQELVDEASHGKTSGVEAVVTAAEAPAVFADRYPASSRLVLTMPRDQLLGSDMPAEIATELKDLDKQLVALLIQLARMVWDRKDAAAVDVITTCVVDLPTGILLQRHRLDSPAAREHLRAAVRAVAEIGPPTPRPRKD